MPTIWPLILDDVIVGAELHVVADAHRRDDDAQIDGDLPADQADAIEQIAALGGIDQPHQAVADFQFHRVQVEQFFDFFRLLLGGFFASSLAATLTAFFSLARSASSASPPQQVPSTISGTLGRPVNIIKPRKMRGDDQRLGLGEDLAEHFIAEIGLAAGAGDDQAGGQRNDERRDLADQPVADGQLGVELTGNPSGPAVLDHADVQAAQDVDEGDDDSGDGVAADEFAGTVHGPVEVRFLRDIGSRRSRASASLMLPAFRSASIAICLPGMASNVNRAATSEMRVAPLVITTN